MSTKRGNYTFYKRYCQRVVEIYGDALTPILQRMPKGLVDLVLSYMPCDRAWFTNIILGWLYAREAKHEAVTPSNIANGLEKQFRHLPEYNNEADARMPVDSVCDLLSDISRSYPKQLVDRALHILVVKAELFLALPAERFIKETIYSSYSAASSRGCHVCWIAHYVTPPADAKYCERLGGAKYCERLYCAEYNPCRNHRRVHICSIEPFREDIDNLVRDAIATYFPETAIKKPCAQQPVKESTWPSIFVLGAIIAIIGCIYGNSRVL